MLSASIPIATLDPLATIACHHHFGHHRSAVYPGFDYITNTSDTYTVNSTWTRRLPQQLFAVSTNPTAPFYTTTTTTTNAAYASTTTTASCTTPAYTTTYCLLTFCCLLLAIGMVFKGRSHHVKGYTTSTPYTHTCMYVLCVQKLRNYNIIQAPFAYSFGISHT